MRNKAPLISMIFNNRQYSENKYGDDAEKKNSEKKSRKRSELILENELGMWISRMSTPPRRSEHFG